jgi:hypothetical protein
MTNLSDYQKAMLNNLPWYYCTYRDSGCTWNSGKDAPEQTRVEARKLLSDHMNKEH